MRALNAVNEARRAGARSLGVFLRDVGHGMLALGHNTLALVGLLVVAAVVFAAGRDDLRHQAELLALDWLQTRQEVRSQQSGEAIAMVAEPDAVARATAADPKALPREQAAVASWISRRYKVAPEPIAALVHEAWALGSRARLDPTLILAIVAIESSFNPFAHSPMGAQGLMQVMTRVHDDKYQAFGGTLAAFDPISNLRVGVQVLKECITRAGGLQEGLRHYVGAALLDSDGGYVGRVLAEAGYLRSVADGRSVSVNAPVNVPAAKDAALPPPAEVAPPTSSAPGADQVASLR
jgi:soluble lytic murein transglycosylase-like protein